MLGLTVLGSGSGGNALVVHDRESGILLDAGFSGRELTRRLAQAGLDGCRIRAIVVSHEHEDHISGLSVVAKRLKVPVFLNRLTAEAVRDRSVEVPQVRIFASGSPFEVEDMTIEPFSIPHDAIDPVGFVVSWNGHRLGVATDLGHVNHLVSHRLQECDLLVLESNHDLAMLRDSQRPWALKQRVMGRHGHLSNDDSMEFVRKVLHPRTRGLVLAHASQECNRYELVAACADKCLTELQRRDVRALVALQDQVLPTLWL